MLLLVGILLPDDGSSVGAEVLTNGRDITRTENHMYMYLVEVDIPLVVGELRGSPVGDGALANGRDNTCTENHMYMYLA